MHRIVLVSLMAVRLFVSVGGKCVADDTANAVLEKAIKAVGGEEKLKQATKLQWKSKQVLSQGEIVIQATAEGLYKYHSQTEGVLNDEPYKGVLVLTDEGGWRVRNGTTKAIDPALLTIQQQLHVKEMIPLMLVALKGKEFKLAPAPETKVDGKPAAGIKVSGRDVLDFVIHFDKASGLPVRTVAKMQSPGSEPYTEEVTFSEYKTLAGIQKATKLESKWDGNSVWTMEILEFKILDRVPPGTFAEPK